MDPAVDLVGAGDAVRHFVAALQGCGPRELHARLQEVERHLRLVESAVVAVLTEADRTRAHLEDGHRSVAGWCRSAVHWSPAEVTARLRCVRVFRQVPDIADALAEGRIGVAQARELARAGSNPRIGDHLGDVAELLVGHAATLDFDGFRLVVRRWELLADVDGAERDRERAHRRRDAAVAWSDNVLYLSARFGAEQGAWVAEVLEAFERAELLADWEAARARYGDSATRDHLERTAGQRRADALHAVCLAAASAPPDGVVAPTVDIVIDDATFQATLEAMTSDEPVPPLGTTGADLDQRRCETVHGTPLTPRAAIAAAVVGMVRRAVLNADGVVINLGRRSRLFTGASREAVWIRGHQCVWPGCRTRQCEVDHRLEWERDGRTDQDNADPLCRHHNLWKRHGLRPRKHPILGWQLHRPDGTVVSPI